MVGAVGVCRLIECIARSVVVLVDTFVVAPIVTNCAVVEVINFVCEDTVERASVADKVVAVNETGFVVMRFVEWKMLYGRAIWFAAVGYLVCKHYVV